MSKSEHCDTTENLFAISFPLHTTHKTSWLAQLNCLPQRSSTVFISKRVIHRAGVPTEMQHPQTVTNEKKTNGRIWTRHHVHLHSRLFRRRRVMILRGWPWCMKIPLSSWLRDKWSENSCCDVVFNKSSRVINVIEETPPREREVDKVFTARSSLQGTSLRVFRLFQ